MAPSHLLRASLLGASLAWSFASSSSARAARPPAVDPAVASGARHPKDAALVVGNEAYAALPQVTWAGEDARSVAAWLGDTRGVSKWRTLTLSDASAADMTREARRVSWRVKRGGTLWVYFAGHGAVDRDGDRLLLGAGAQGADLTGDALALDTLIATLERSRRADRVVVVLDAGFGNVGRDGLELVPGQPDPDLSGFEDGATDRTTTWAATSGAEPAQAFVAAKHGLFTWAALGALRGWADGELDGQPDGKVTLDEAQAYAARLPRQLGQLQRPSRALRSEPLGWVLNQGTHLEVGPDDALLATLARQDLDRRIGAAEAAVRADAAAFWTDTLALAQQGGDGGKEALQAYITEFSSARASVSWGVYVPEVREAVRVLRDYDAQGVPAAAVAAVAPTAACDDLLALEGPAMLGQLSDGQMACLDGRVATERLQTTKSKISLLMLVHAEASGDRQSWQRLMARHLEDIDRSDPDLCFAYALFLHRTGDLELGEEVVRWASVALENKQTWQGEAFTKKVSGLLRLQAEASHRLWLAAEKAYRIEANGENEAMTETFRGWAKDYSREWLDYTRAAGAPSDKALELCRSAAGTNAFCAEGASQ